MPPQISITPQPVAPGAKVRVDGSGFDPEIRTELGFDGRDYTINRWRPSPEGAFTTGIRIPSGTSVGKHIITVRRYDSKVVLTSRECLVGTAAPAPGVSITDIRVSAVTQTGAVISWHVSAPSTGRLEYRVKGTTTWRIREPQHTDPDVTDHVQDVVGLAAGTEYETRVISNGVTAAGPTFKTLAASPAPDPVPVPGPIDPTRVVIPDSATSAANIRDFLASQQGKPTALRTKAYSLGGPISFDDLTGVDLDTRGASLDFTTPCKMLTFARTRDAKVFSSAERMKLTGRLRAGAAPGTWYLTSSGGIYPEEHHHVLSFVGCDNVEVSDFTHTAVGGDTAYLDCYGTKPATGVHVHHFHALNTGRMVWGIVAARGLRGHDYTIQDVAYTDVDFEPDRFTPGVTIQGAWDCEIWNGVSRGWQGRIYHGSTLYDYAVAIQIGTPHDMTGIVVDDIRVHDMQYLGGKTGALTRVGQGAYRPSRLDFRNITGAKYPTGWGAVFIFDGVDGLTIQNLRNPTNSGPVSIANSTGVNDLGGHSIAPLIAGFLPASITAAGPVRLPPRHPGLREAENDRIDRSVEERR